MEGGKKKSDPPAHKKEVCAPLFPSPVSAPPPEGPQFVSAFSGDDKARVPGEARPRGPGYSLP